MDEADYIPINQWSEEDQPREKLLRKGIASLTNAELLAILMRSGSKKESAVDLAQKLLLKADYKLHLLSRLSLKDLKSIRGIGEVKAMGIMAALEIGKRRKLEEGLSSFSISSSQLAYQVLAPILEDLKLEQFWILLLDRKNAVIKSVKISEGGVSGTVVDSKVIFKIALENMASGIILAHNHPSGQLKASKADLDITRKIKEASKLLDLSLLDHLIITATGYLSLADEGLM